MNSLNQEIAPATLLSVIERAATDNAVDVDKMERLLAMHERVCAQQAEAAFNDAMKTAQSQMPRIHRDAINPATNSRYARLESLLETVTPIYTQNGFSLSFGTAECPLPNHYRITCVVSHSGGHSRNYQCDVPADILGAKGNQNKTATHGFGSTMSYGRRYLTLLIFNIALVNEDNDGRNTKSKAQGPASPTADMRKRFVAALDDIREKALAYAIDMALIEPNQGLDQWPLEHIPMTKAEFNELRKDIQEHQ